MGRPQPLKVGPFIGGMNTASDPSAVAENELVDCQNFELDLDGSLVSRPAILETTNNSATTTERLVMIGRAVLAGGNYVFASNVNGTYAFNGTTWTTVKTGLTSRVAVQYQDKVYIVAQTGSAQDGGYWDGTTWTADTNMPRGEAAVFFKSRLFVVPGISATGAAAHQLRFTDPIAVGVFTLTWTATNNIPVSQGDGQKLIDLQVYNDNLMLFKQDSSYVLAYDLNPTDAILRQINDNIGASTRKCVVSYENSVFILHEGNVFEVANYNFQRINLKLPFILDSATPAGTSRAETMFLCLLGDRLLVRYYNNVYCYELRTKTWSRWQSQSSLLGNFGPLVAMPTFTAVETYYAGSSITEHENIYSVINGYGAATESTLSTNYNIECSILTKNYDLGESHFFKKLSWWGADVLSTDAIVGVASPVVLNFGTTWNQLHAFTWNQLHSRTWDQPMTSLAPTVTNVSDNSTPSRKFIKFLKALRFRQINFRVTLITDGSTSDGPPRVFSLTAIVGSKEGVVKQVS